MVLSRVALPRRVFKLQTPWLAALALTEVSALIVTRIAPRRCSRWILCRSAREATQCVAAGPSREAWAATEVMRTQCTGRWRSHPKRNPDAERAIPRWRALEVWTGPVRVD